MKIAIVGSGETYIYAPYDDPSWTIWGFSRRNFNKYPRCDKWFELHHPRNYPRYELVVPGYTAFIENAVKYDDFPFESIIKEFGPYFLTEGQAPWMMAYAIQHGPGVIGLWGIEGIEKHHAQRHEIHYFAEMARIRGIDVTSPQNELLKPGKLYAYETDTLDTLLDRLGINEVRKAELYANPPARQISL